MNLVKRSNQSNGDVKEHTPGRTRESTISNLAPKCFASAFAKVS